MAGYGYPTGLGPAGVECCYAAHGANLSAIGVENAAFILFNNLVCYRLDRVARSLKQLIETVEDLEARGIGFKSLNEQIDTTSAGGKLVFHIFASLAEFERSLIRSRTMAGLEAAKARGRVGGRPKS